MSVGILGGGFGIYGYLPAAVLNGNSVMTLARYKNQIANRPELKSYLSQIEFVEHQETLLKMVDSLVIARNPQNQFDLLFKLAGDFEHVYLEKPLALEFASHRQLLDHLLEKQQSFSLGYLVQFTNWFNQIDFEKTSRVEIFWEVRINEDSWKSRDFPDKGLFSFFGIHLLPIIERLATEHYSLDLNPMEDGIHIEGKFGKRSLIIKLISGDEFKFEVRSQGDLGETLVNQVEETPFGRRSFLGSPDNRIPLLQKYLASGNSKSMSEKAIRYEEIYLRILANSG
jgi:hypothetical protein